MRTRIVVSVFLFVVALCLGSITASLARAQSTVNQGSGSSAAEEWKVNVAARRVGETTETCITNGAGGTTTPATPLAQRKAIEVFNGGPNSIYCTVDGSAPLSTGANGRKIAADGSWALDAGPSIALRCIAATAAQVTPACAMVTELR